jgi:hypothetical protein
MTNNERCTHLETIEVTELPEAPIECEQCVQARKNSPSRLRFCPLSPLTFRFRVESTCRSGRSGASAERE